MGVESYESNRERLAAQVDAIARFLKGEEVEGDRELAEELVSHLRFMSGIEMRAVDPDAESLPEAWAAAAPFEGTE